MLGELEPATRDVATAVVLYLPGFIALSVFEITNPRIARHRLTLQLILWSLAISLVLFAATHGVFRLAGWPRDPLDPEFHLPLLGIALVAGYGAGQLAGSRLGANITGFLRILTTPWVWVEVLSSDRFVVIHLDDGTVLYGHPLRFTDDPRQAVREIYLEQPHILTEDPESGQEQYVPLSYAEGILIESSRIRFIEQMVDTPIKVEVAATTESKSETLDPDYG